MANIEKVDEPKKAAGAKRLAQEGKALLKTLAPSLQERGVPSSSYIMVNTVNGEFVTGKSRKEARQRFAIMHPDAEGWMQRVGDVTGEPDDPPDERAPNAASPRFRSRE